MNIFALGRHVLFGGGGRKLWLVISVRPCPPTQLSQLKCLGGHGVSMFPTAAAISPYHASRVSIWLKIISYKCKSAKWCAKWVTVHINLSGKGNVALLFIVTLVWHTQILGVRNVRSNCCYSTRCTQVSPCSRIWNNTVKQTLVFSTRKLNYCPAVSVCGQLARPDTPELQLTAAEPRNRFTAKRLSYAVKHVAYYASSLSIQSIAILI